MKELITTLTITAMALFCFHSKAEDPNTPEKTVGEIASETGEFSMLEKAIEAAGISDELAQDGPITLFAPNDEAFGALPDGVLDELMKPENKEDLKQLLNYHLVTGKVMAEDVEKGNLASVNGDPITVSNEEGEVKVDDAKIVKSDLLASNGVIHVIDAVIMPE